MSDLNSRIPSFTSHEVLLINLYLTLREAGFACLQEEQPSFAGFSVTVKELPHSMFLPPGLLRLDEGSLQLMMKRNGVVVYLTFTVFGSSLLMTSSESGERSSTFELDVTALVDSLAVDTINGRAAELQHTMESMGRIALLDSFGSAIKNRAMLEGCVGRLSKQFDRPAARAMAASSAQSGVGTSSSSLPRSTDPGLGIGIWPGPAYAPDGLLIGPSHPMFLPRGDAGGTSGGYPGVPRPGIRYDPIVPDLSRVDPGRIAAPLPPRRTRLPGEPNPDHLQPPQFDYDFYG